MDIGPKIRAARKAANLTQEQLAQKSGVATITIRQYEAGKRQPRVEQLRAIADALGVLITQLVDFSDVDLSAFSDTLGDSLIESGTMLSRVTQKLDTLKKQNAPPEEIKKYEDIRKQISRGMLEIANLTVQSNQTQKVYEKMLLSYFNELNDEGQGVAVDRLKELSEIPRYQRQESHLESIPEPPENKK